jgi:nucleotide-binding universal stress UspA family protein
MFHRIFAPLDGSTLAERSLPYVESLAQQYSAEVILGWVVQLRTHALSDFEPINYGLVNLLDTTREREQATHYLTQQQRRLQGRHIRASYQVVESISIADGIVTIANDVKADLIVKTTYARLGPSRWLQGNVAALVMQRAPCPLFLVRVSAADGHDERTGIPMSSLEHSS